MADFIISGFADEIDQSTDKQFAHLNELGISYFEPRGIDGKNISELTLSEAKELKEKMDRCGIKASSIGSPIGKIKITDDFSEHIKLLEHVIEIAKILDTKYIRVFSFFIPKGEDPAKYRDEVLSRMKKMAEVAEKNGVILLHENEKDIYGDIAPRCKDIFDNVKSPALRGVFDPANFVQCGQVTYPDAFELLKDDIVYMHIKDAFFEDGRIVPAGSGDGHVKEIISELAAKDYKGFLSLEPHLGVFGGLDKLELDDHMLELEKSDAGMFTIAYEALKKIIDEVN